MSLKLPLALTLFINLAFAVAGLGVLANAFVKSNDEQSNVRRLLPSGTTITINSSGAGLIKPSPALSNVFVHFTIPDLLNPGKVSATIHALLIVLSLLSLFVLHTARYSSPRGFFFLALALGFAAVWLFATTIAFTVVFANDAAHVTASSNGVPLPAAVIADQARTLGLNAEYRNHHYRQFVLL
jgi:hypothetical protein